MADELVPDIDLTGSPLDPVPRKHAELRRFADGGWTVVDLGSPNGIELNGVDVPSNATVP